MRFKDENVNKNVAEFINNGIVNGPVIVIAQGEKNAFTSPDSPLIKESMDKKGGAELIENTYSEEYYAYKKFDAQYKYPYPFIGSLAPRYKALIKTSSEIVELYKGGDMDIAENRKIKLGNSLAGGRHFCNLYGAGYIPQLLSYINKVKLSDADLIQQLLEHTLRYNGIIFVSNVTNVTENSTLYGRVLKLIMYDSRGDHEFSQPLHYIAIHAFGAAVPFLKEIKAELEKRLAENTIFLGMGYKIKFEHLRENAYSNVIFILDDIGEKVYSEYMENNFKGFPTV